MSEFPEGWFRGTPEAGRQAGPPGSNEPTASWSAGTQPPGSRGGSPWPDQPPSQSSYQNPSGHQRPASYQGSGYSGGSGFGRTGWRKWLRPRRVLGIIGILVALILVGTVALYFNLNGKLHRENVLVDYSGRPAQGSGTNWLIAGSDSRQGLTRKQERHLSTGQGIGGHRSDTIMILHMGPGNPPTLISLPRDSWVPIPGVGNSKINAAFALGGPTLLAKTVQNVTGLRIDHYMEIGFGGFVKVVNAVGGVRMCVKHPLNDPASGLHIRRGCHVLHGKQALGFVRDRHSFASGQDLQRIQDQRLLLKALLGKLTSTGTLINPFSVIPAASGAASTLTVDKGTSLLQLAGVAFALKNPQTTTVPIANSNFFVSGQSAVEWNRSEALQLFRDLNQGKPVPKRLISGSHQAS
jgi:LCP family protein required for cell wall assembly